MEEGGAGGEEREEGMKRRRRQEDRDKREVRDEVRDYVMERQGKEAEC